MRYFFDTEFIERQVHPLFGKPYHRIDLISIGIVSEDGREYYAISRDFNPARADEWVQENVLKGIVQEYVTSTHGEHRQVTLDAIEGAGIVKGVKYVQNMIGRSREQIAEEIIDFVNPHMPDRNGIYVGADGEFNFKHNICLDEEDDAYGFARPEFYAYFAAYDWVVLCTLFGRMIDLPEGFPMFCYDLKQQMEELGYDREWKVVNCPNPVGEHNALVDAKWNRKLWFKMQLPIATSVIMQKTDHPHADLIHDHILTTIPDLKEEEKVEAEVWQPGSFDEAVECIMRQVPEPIRTEIKAGTVTEDHFTGGNHFFGAMNVRSNWFLWWQPNHGYKGWPAEKPKLVEYFNSIGIHHADDMSGILFTTVYRRIAGKDDDILSQASRYKTYWESLGYPDGNPSGPAPSPTMSNQNP